MKFLSFATSVTLAVLASRVAAGNTARASLFARQLPIDPTLAPEQCAEQCNGLATLTTGCAALDCLCSAEVASGMADCLACGVALNSEGLTAEGAQEVYDSFAESCTAAGATVPPFDFADGAGSGSDSDAGTDTESDDTNDDADSDDASGNSGSNGGSSSGNGSGSSSGNNGGSGSSGSSDSNSDSDNNSENQEDSGNSASSVAKSGLGMIGAAVVGAYLLA